MLYEVITDRLLRQGRRRAGLHARSARDAFAVHEIRAAGAHLGVETASYNFV